MDKLKYNLKQKYCLLNTVHKLIFYRKLILYFCVDLIIFEWIWLFLNEFFHISSTWTYFTQNSYIFFSLMTSNDWFNLQLTFKEMSTIFVEFSMILLVVSYSEVFNHKSWLSCLTRFSRVVQLSEYLNNLVFHGKNPSLVQ